MSKIIIEWVIGPQVIGIIFIIAGLIQKTWPPKHINNLYGYRMPSSKQNQQTWDEANRYSARYMIKAGVVLCMLGILVSVLFHIIPMSMRIKDAIWRFLMLATAMGSAVSLIVATERHLEKPFPKQP